MRFLRNDTLPHYFFSHYRFFEPGEKHITRTFFQDVLLLVIDGVLRFQEAGIPVEVFPGEYYIQQAGLYQEGILPSGAPAYFYIHFQGEWSETGGIAHRGTFDMERLADIHRLSILEESNAPFIDKAAVFFHILASLHGDVRRSPKEKAAEQIKMLLSTHLADGISVDQLAKELNFSANYIIRIFKEVAGCTPHRYLQTLRIQKARQLLTYADLSADRIASECGFSSYANFYKEFAKQTGISPREFRKRSR